VARRRGGGGLDLEGDVLARVGNLPAADDAVAGDGGKGDRKCKAPAAPGSRRPPRGGTQVGLVFPPRGPPHVVPRRVAVYLRVDEGYEKPEEMRYCKLLPLHWPDDTSTSWSHRLVGSVRDGGPGP
jgi:hypothetical protein